MTRFYIKTVADLVQGASFELASKSSRTVDIVRDVTNLASTYWIADNFGIPLKTKENPHGLITPQELYLALSAMFIFVFLNFDPAAGWKLKSVRVSVTDHSDCFLLTLIRTLGCIASIPFVS
jgi:hypothetical protein